MTSGTIPVRVEWALEGKQPDGEDYRILACSTGELNRANFADALSRFQLGELNTLPQVSASWARLRTKPYLALAIHWHALEGQRLADGVSPRDNQGRLTAYTSYFCLPYKDLAPAGIGYLAIYEALRALTLSVTDGPPKEVRIAIPTSRTPAVDDLAVRVAPLLLTGQPVCVLGAEGTGMHERLAFIDAVMDLLPYGFRSRMTAATWTRATNRNHRFRLFFTDTQRADEPDHVVMWDGDPDQVPAPDREAGDYFDWLQDKIGPLARLAELTTEMGFGRKGVIQALDAVLTTGHRLQPRHRPAALSPNGRSAQPALPAAQAEADAGEKTLLACAEDAKLANPTRLRTDIAFLKRFAENEIGGDRRERYRELITRLGLLRHNFLVEEKHEERLYEALLRLAFGTPLGYQSYCQVEKCAGIAHGEAPHRGLLAAIVKAGLADLVVGAIVYWHLREADDKRLGKFLSGIPDPVIMIQQLGAEWTYPQHARIFCDVTLEYLRKERGRYEAQQLRSALRQYGFLARALQVRHPDKDQYQVHTLYQFLRAAYPQPADTPGQDLSRAAIVQILDTADAPPPTPALLSAVLMLVEKPGSWELAWKAYVHGSLARPRLDEPTTARLRGRLPSIDAVAIKAQEPWLETDPAQSGAR
jgi:hypothetical protein